MQKLKKTTTHNWKQNELSPPSTWSLNTHDLSICLQVHCVFVYILHVIICLILLHNSIYKKQYLIFSFRFILFFAVQILSTLMTNLCKCECLISIFHLSFISIDVSVHVHICDRHSICAHQLCAVMSACMRISVIGTVFAHTNWNIQVWSHGYTCQCKRVMSAIINCNHCLTCCHHCTELDEYSIFPVLLYFVSPQE